MIISYRDGIDPAYTDNNPFKRNCIYCGSPLVFEEIDKFTKYSINDFKKDLRSNEIIVKDFEPTEEYPYDIDLSLLDESYYKLSEDNFWHEDTYIGRCMVCGWWKIIEEFNTVNDNIWQIFFEIVGTIRHFEITDLSIPISEIRTHLVRKYTDRFNVNPRAFENVVVSVFGDLGYNGVCTAYSNDGGIDAVLSGKGEPIAIQVKRTKNNIKVEQIRSFLGALIVNNFNRGIYVSTADYQSGCNKITKKYPINLINGSQFYEKLKEAQIIYNSKNWSIDISKIGSLYHTGCFPMNSL